MHPGRISYTGIFGLTEAEFNKGKAQVEAVISTRQQWVNGKGAAEQATQ